MCCYNVRLLELETSKLAYIFDKHTVFCVYLSVLGVVAICSCGSCRLVNWCTHLINTVFMCRCYVLLQCAAVGARDR